MSAWIIFLFLCFSALSLASYVIGNTESTNNLSTVSAPSSTQPSRSFEDHPKISYLPEETLPSLGTLQKMQAEALQKEALNRQSNTNIEFTSYSKKVWPGGTGRVSIAGKPNTLYNITVLYSSGPSEARGLSSKYSDSKGNVSWSWAIGSNTYSGTYKITVSGGGNTAYVYFEVA